MMMMRRRKIFQEEEEEEKNNEHDIFEFDLFSSPSGINEAQDLQNFKHDVGTQRLVNRRSLLRLKYYISELEALPIKFVLGVFVKLVLHWIIFKTLFVRVSDYAKHYEILILSSDIARLLRGSRLTNCMSREGSERVCRSRSNKHESYLEIMGLHFYDDASWTRTTMLHCMICGFRTANFPQDGIKKHKGTLYLKIQIHFESGSIIKYTEGASGTYDNDCMAHV